MVNNTAIYTCKVVIINFLLMYRVHSRDHSPASIASLLSLLYFLLGMDTTLDDITDNLLSITSPKTKPRFVNKKVELEIIGHHLGIVGKVKFIINLNQSIESPQLKLSFSY